MRAIRTANGQIRPLVNAGLALLLLSAILGPVRSAIARSAAAGVAAQVGYGKAGGTGPESDLPHIKSFEGQVVNINVDQGAIAIEDKKGNKMVFAVDKKTKFKADKKTDLEDKKKIELADFKSGETVRVSYTEGTSRASEVRLRSSDSK
jgi:hypothetical protein